MSELVTSAANPVVKRVRALADRKARRREGAFMVEGVQPVRRAAEAGWEIDTLLVVPDRLPASAVEFVAGLRAATRVVELAEPLAARLADRETPPGLLAVVRDRDTPLPEPAPDALYVALHEVANPGNLGTVVRTADAVGAAGMILIGRTADPYAPAAVKASMGSLFAVPIARMPDPAAFLGWAGRRGVEVVATSGYAEREHWTTRYRTPAAVLLGSEGDGLPPEVLERADRVVRVPMAGTPESLNLAVAAALVLYEVRRPPRRVSEQP